MDMNWRSDMDISESLVGHRLLSVVLDQGDDTLTFETDRGRIVWATEGDCCSKSWFEYVDFGWVKVQSITPVGDAA